MMEATQEDNYGGQKSITDLLAMPEAADNEFEPPRLRGKFHELPDLS